MKLNRYQDISALNFNDIEIEIWIKSEILEIANCIEEVIKKERFIISLIRTRPLKF
jgi:hypothetical protein